jgi:hypothetical protein
VTTTESNPPHPVGGSVRELVKALEFYADPATYHLEILGPGGLADDKDERDDFGRRARAALAALKHPQPTPAGNVIAKLGITLPVERETQFSNNEQEVCNALVDAKGRVILESSNSYFRSVQYESDGEPEGGGAWIDCGTSDLFDALAAFINGVQPREAAGWVPLQDVRDVVAVVLREVGNTERERTLADMVDEGVRRMSTLYAAPLPPAPPSPAPATEVKP